MVLGATVESHAPGKAPIFSPTSLSSKWKTVIDAGGMDDNDNSGNRILDPEGSITESTRHKLTREGDRGTNLRVRMGYDRATSTVTTSPTIQVFGRYVNPADANDVTAWQMLANKSGDTEVVVTVDPTNDVDDGSDFQYTLPDANDHTFDCDGCNEFLFGVKTIPNTNGDESLAFLEAKFL